MAAETPDAHGYKSGHTNHVSTDMARGFVINSIWQFASSALSGLLAFGALGLHATAGQSGAAASVPPAVDLAVTPSSKSVATPESDGFSNRTNWWSFQPAVFPPIPDGPGLGTAGNPIDRFILAKLSELKIHPSAEADRRTLIRRLTFDLTGLPPTPEQVAEFVGDRAPDAYERLVDRLLTSPRYGECWARHWLDVVHFGETHGYDKDKLRTNSWPYRDYVIGAFNKDKSYSRFIEEQLAGDVLFPDNPEGVAALGFIAAGPWDYVGHAELPISKTDGLIARYNDRDDMVMTTISTFQSLTVHCARCHDHKFDPISQKDYYGLQAVFAGVDRAERPYDTDLDTYRKRRALLAEKKGLAKRRETLEQEIAKVSSPEIDELDRQLAAIRSQINPDVGESKSPSNGYHSQVDTMRDTVKWVQVDLDN